MRKRNPLHVVLVAAAIGVLSLGASQAWGQSDDDTDLSGYWLHVRVHEGDDGKVSVNLPLSMVDKFTPMIKKEHFDGSRIEVDGDVHMSIEDLRQMWSEIRNGPDMTYVSVEEEFQTVTVAKEAGYLLVKVDEIGDDPNHPELVKSVRGVGYLFAK